MIAEIIESTAPLLLLSFGALISEYAGRLALFLDSVINMAAFLCFAFTVLTGSAAAGTALSVLCCTGFIMAAAYAAEHFRANPFLAFLAVGLFLEALITAVSVKIFGTRGVLTSEAFSFPPQTVRITAAAVCFAITGIIIFILHFTKKGLYYRIAGTDEDVLESRGINTTWYRIKAAGIAAACAAVAGCTFSMEISAFVPNIASGRGWIALAAVFLGRKKSLHISTAVIIFSAAEYAASHFQNILPGVPSALLISLPYLTALILIILHPDKKH